MDDPPEKPAKSNSLGNEAEDGSYTVGKKKPPEHGKFRKNDGRARGRRAKGTKNFRTDFEEEMGSKITLTVDGKPRRVTRQRAIVMRLADNASRGQNAAIQTTLKYTEKFEGGIGRTAIDGDSFDPSLADEVELPCLGQLTIDELRQFNILIHKAQGIPYVPADLPSHPLDYLSDRDDPRNWYMENTVDGLHYLCCLIPSIGKELTAIDNRAYLSAALTRKTVFDRLFN